MRISVGIDIAKEIHWVTAIDAGGVVQVDRKLLNTPAGIATLVDELTALRGTVRIGLDVIGGIAGLAEAMLADAGFALVHVPGIAVNRARQGTVGGENKSDPRDARTIAEQVRTRSDLRPIEPATELDLEIRLLVGRRSDIVQAQTQRLSRMRDLLVGIFPGLEACLDLKTKGPLHLLTKFVTPPSCAMPVRSVWCATCKPAAECRRLRILPIAFRPSRPSSASRCQPNA